MIGTIHGTLGEIAVPAGFGTKLQSWRATLEGREFNTTGFGDGGWITGEIINGRVSGDAIGVIDEGVPVPAAVMQTTFGGASMKGTVTITAATGKTWSFSALITMAAMERAEEVTGHSVYRISFVSSGPVTQTWA